MSKSNKPVARPATFVKKEAKSKFAPTDSLDIVLNSNGNVGDYLRLFVGSGTDLRRELIIHHPIGMTALDKSEWIASETGDVAILLSRLVDPKAKEIAAEKAEWLNEQLVAAGLLFKTGTGEYVLREDRTLTRKQFLDNLREKIAKEGEKEKGADRAKLLIALADTKDPLCVNETEIRDRLKTLGPEADARFASDFETRGGSRNDRPQVPIRWANNLSKSELSDHLVNYGLNGPPVAANNCATVVSATPSNISVATAHTTGPTSLWYDIPIDIPSEYRRGLLNDLKTIRYKFKKYLQKDIAVSIKYKTSTGGSSV